MLWWRATLEKEARASRLEMENRVADLESTAARSRADRGAAPDGSLAIGDLLEWSRYLERMRRFETRIEERLDDLRPRLAERVQAHLAARRDVKALEKLKERARRRETRVLERRAQKASDEAAARTKLPGPGRIDRVGRGERDAESSPEAGRCRTQGVSITQEGAPR